MVFRTSAAEALSNLLSIWTGGNWFINCYVVLLLFVPVINMVIEKLPQQDYFKLIKLLSLFGFILPTVKFYSGFNVNCSFEGMIIMYLIGGYIARFGFDFIGCNIKEHFSIWLLVAIFLIGFFYFICDILANKIGVGKFNTLPMSMLFFINGLVFPIGLLYIFLQHNYYNTIINQIARSVLAIYIIHDNPLTRKIIWYKWLPNIDYVNTDLFFLHFILKCSIIFVVCLGIDQIRLLISSVFATKRMINSKT